MPTGDYLAYYDVPITDGCFILDMGAVMLRGDTNPITGSDVEAALELTGCFIGPDIFCGEATGRVTVPAEIDLTGSTFAGTAIEPGVLPDEFPSSC